MESLAEKPTLKNRTIWILAAVITVLVFVFTALTHEMAYLTIDDGSIQNVFSGYFTGTPFPVQQYINVIISFPITGLYKLFPGVQWWYVWSLAAMAVGIFLVHFCFLKLACKNRIFLPVVFGILAFLDIGFFIYPIANVAFTIVPAILGAGLVAGLFWLGEKDEIKYRKWIFIGILVGFIILYCHRRATGQVLLCYILLAFLYFYVSRSTNWKKTVIQFLVTAGIFLVTMVSLNQINSVVQHNYHGSEFYVFNSARSQYMDYPHDTYDENPELYEEVGWDRDIYLLASNWCFLPEEVNAESLAYLSGESSEFSFSDQKALIKEIYQDDLDRSILKLYLASIIIAAFCMIIWRNKKNLIFFLLNNIGTIALIYYQIFIGRTLYRTLMVVLVPAVVINLMLSVNRKMENKAIRCVHAALVLAMGIVCLSPMLGTTFDKEHNESMAKYKENDTLIRQYRAEHPDNFYINQMGLEHNLNPEYCDYGGSNFYSWGGAVFYSASFQECLRVNDLSALNGDTLKNDKVYFISRTNAMDESYHDGGSNLFAALLRYLEKDCDALGFVMEDEITDGAYVYHFVFDENADDYAIYYDIVDGYTVEIDAAAAD